MATWEIFEKQCTSYLNDRFGQYAKFIHQGSTDSTVPDILVQTNTGKSFYIEVKLSPAQCGQFVLLPNFKTRTFEYSNRNDTSINKATQIIINFMNENFDEFKDVGTTGKDINLSNGVDIFTEWIILTYKAKRVEFFITNNYKIIPITNFKEYFDVSAKYRVKRSGSSNVGKNYIYQILDHLKTQDYKITDTIVAEDKLFVTSPNQLHENKFIFNGIEYMFSLRKDKYEIRKLSNTYNANVIFSIKCKKSILGIPEIKFTDYLK